MNIILAYLSIVGYICINPKLFSMRIIKVTVVTLLTLLCFGVKSQVVFFIDSLPANTPDEDSIFMASSLNGWQPHDNTFLFQEAENGKYRLVVNAVKDTFEYKICRGDWKKVEVLGDGRDVDNRIYFPDVDTVRVKVHGWRDLMPKAKIKSTAGKNVRFMPTSIEMPELERRRTIVLYLPPNYFKSNYFPVIYMQDGQNLFDDATAFAGEWHVDEIMDSLYTYRGFAAIVVGIYNGGDERLNEYSPWRNDSLGFGGDGDKYVDFVVKTLKPFIDEHYRTDPRAESTVIMGSSMGGLISLYTVLEHPKKFGKAAIFSPSMWFSPNVWEFLSKVKPKGNQKMYFYGGEKEGENNEMVEALDSVKSVLKGRGFDVDNDLKFVTQPDGRHSEFYWSREFPEAVKFLFNLK